MFIVAIVYFILAGLFWSLIGLLVERERADITVLDVIFILIKGFLVGWAAPLVMIWIRIEKLLATVVVKQ